MRHFSRRGYRPWQPNGVGNFLCKSGKPMTGDIFLLVKIPRPRVESPQQVRQIPQMMGDQMADTILDLPLPVNGQQLAFQQDAVLYFSDLAPDNHIDHAVLVFDGHELPAALAALEAFPNAISILDAGSWREGTAKLAELVDYLVTSEPFAMRASAVANLGSNEAQRDCVRELRDRFGAITIVTLGENGLVADDGSGFRHFPAYPAEAVDTTAAGDIFHGALVYAIASKIAFDESLRFAAMAASLSVRVAGGRGSIPTLDQVKEALRHAG